VKDETPFRYGHTKILAQVVVIGAPTSYQLDHGIYPRNLWLYTVTTVLSEQLAKLWENAIYDKWPNIA